MNNGDKKTKGKFVYVLIQVLGVFLLILGVLGILLPILPGWPLIFFGLLILGADVAFRDRIINIFPERFRPVIRHHADKIYAKKHK
jgi:uncharacterized membrane protein YbaN (DUF454 family)